MKFIGHFYRILFFKQVFHVAVGNVNGLLIIITTRWVPRRCQLNSHCRYSIGASSLGGQRIDLFFTLRTVFVPMRSFFVSRCSFQFMKLLFPLFFIFQNRCITRIFFFQDFWKKTFFSRISGKKLFFPGFLEKKLFFQDFWNQLFTQAGFILKTFSKGKKIIFCMEFLKIICLGEFCFLSNVVPKAQAFFVPSNF